VNNTDTTTSEHDAVSKSCSNFVGKNTFKANFKQDSAGKAWHHLNGEAVITSTVLGLRENSAVGVTVVS
jgi:hypothetical protein